MTDISRRSFFKKTGLAAGAIAASSLIPVDIFNKLIKKFEVKPEESFSEEYFCKWFEDSVNESLGGHIKIHDTELMGDEEARGYAVYSLFEVNEKTKYIAFMIDSPEKVYNDIDLRSMLARNVCDQIKKYI